MKRFAAVVVLAIMVVGCGDDPLPTQPRFIDRPVPFEPIDLSGGYQGSFTVVQNNVNVSGALGNVALQQGTRAEGTWAAVGRIGVPGDEDAFIYSGTFYLILQPDNVTISGRWDVEVIDPVTETVLCADSADWNGSVTSSGMTWVSPAFTACNSPATGVAPVGVAVNWNKLTLLNSTEQ